MANGYQPPDDEPETPQDVPDEPKAEGAQPAKISQAQANYRESDKTRCCGLCANFTGSAGPDPFKCTKVEGEISPFGFSRLYEKQDNPFREGETGEFTGGVPVAPPMAAVGGVMPMPFPGGPDMAGQPGGGTLTAAASPPPQVSNPRTMQTSVMQPRLRIGGKIYGG